MVLPEVHQDLKDRLRLSAAMFLQTPVDDRALTEACALVGLEEKFKIERFLPYTTKRALPKSMIFVRMYLALPFVWPLLGAQSFLVYRKP
jgi:hypothetical protein